MNPQASEQTLNNLGPAPHILPEEIPREKPFAPSSSMAHDSSGHSSSSNQHDEEKSMPPSVTDREDGEGGDDGTPPDQPQSSHPPAPEGGRKAWMVALGSTFIFFATLGFNNSIGTLIQYYETHQLKGQSESKISWIGSLPAFLQFFTGMIGGPLFDRYGAKVIRPSSIIYIFAIMMLSLCKEYYQFMLCQGVLMGISMGLLQFPAFAAVSQYFCRRRAAALGLVVSGSSLGGVVLPIALSKMLNSTSLGYGWTIRIIGFILLPLMIFACLTVEARLPPRKTEFWIMSAFKEPMYMTITLAFFFQFLGMYMPLFYLPTYATTQGVSPTMAGYLLSILNAASTFGRIIPGIIADKYGRINMFGAGGLIAGIIIYCMSEAHTLAGLIVYAVFFGFASGMIISGGSSALSVCPQDSRNIGTYMGMGMAMASFGALIGPPINGAFISAYGGFFEVCMFSGTICTIGGLIAVGSKYYSSKGLLGVI